MTEDERGDGGDKREQNERQYAEKPEKHSSAPSSALSSTADGNRSVGFTVNAIPLSLFLGKRVL